MDVKAFFQKEGIRFRKEKNQYFSSINNQENQLHYLVSGVCALVRFTKNGEEIIYHYFKEGDVIGGVPLFLSHFRKMTDGNGGTGGMYNYCSLYTKTECVLYKVPFLVVERKIKENPEFACIIGACISRHFMEMITHNHTAMEEHTTERLCRTLLQLADWKNSRLELQKYFTYTELARYLGVHSMTVSKIMLSLKKMGIIEKEGHKIIIRDPEKLEDLAEHSGEFACEEL